jgi:hypothetical protein
VAVEVVGLEVEQDGGPRAELVNVLELKGGDLADHAGSGRHSSVELAERAADVARDGCAQHHAEQLTRRRLAVRAGDRDDLDALKEPVAELELAPHRHATRPRGPHGWRLARHARALDHELDGLQHVLVLGAQPDFDTRFGKPPHVEVVPAIRSDHAHPAARKRKRRRLPRASEADDERRSREDHPRKER